MDGGAWQATVHRVSKSQRGLSDFTFPFPDSSVKNPPAMQETPVRFLGQEDSPGERIGYSLQYSWASLVAQLIKNLPAMQEIWVQSPGQEDPLEKEMATHSSILAWKIPWTAGLLSMVLQKVGHN